MSTTLLILVGVVIAIALVVVVLLLSFGGGGEKQQAAVSANLRNLVTAQRERQETERRGGSPQKGKNSAKASLAFAAAEEGELNRKQVVKSARMDLEKKLRYARWPVTPLQFRAIQLVITIAIVVPVYLNFTIFMVLMFAFLTPRLLTGILDRAIQKRYDAFDVDYPVLLNQFVSMLRTGMATLTGLENAGKALDEDSLIRAEVELMIERLRLGVTEEQAIGAFGEDIAHPEIELFVQSLILSRRVGGTLSLTLERLSKQVRKRQEFRKKAVAAVGMERSSLYMIAVIMGLLMMYLGWSAPALVKGAFEHELGRKIFQFGIMCIFMGFYWSRKVTEIKI